MLNFRAETIFMNTCSISFQTYKVNDHIPQEGIS